MKIGNRNFQTDRHTYVMGILNLTPDSFSDGGRYNSMDKALFHAQEMINEGADIIDVGGESTRPGHTRITDEEEIARTAPVIEALKGRFDIPLSLDTYKSRVARAGIEAGADLINDIWGLRSDPEMAGVIAAAGKPCCLMHNRGKALYDDLIAEIEGDLLWSAAAANEAGIDKGNIILDPGIGFGKTYEQNLKALECLDTFTGMGYPVLLGVSKKSVIGLTLDVPPDERGAGTAAVTALAVLRGCAFVRVHNVKENVHTIKMLEAIRDVSL